jgi:Zn-dependent peptidase ImmA (M78 family)
MSIPDVADRLKRPAADIERWESGDAAPTYAQLERLAYSVYKRPLAVFFLPEPPREPQPRREFRTLPQADLDTLSRDTHLQIRRAHAYQLALRELFEGGNPAPRRIWQVLSLSRDRSIARQAEAIRDVLRIDMETQASWSSDERALKAWRTAIEDVGVFVFKNAFKQKDISGFCLTDPELPLIYLNNSTTKTRQTFSLLHELAHLLLDVSGIGKLDPSYVDRMRGPAQAIERFCNAMAAAVLIPEADFRRQLARLPSQPEDITEEHLAQLAGRYGVSRETTLRLLVDQGRFPRSLYDEKAKAWAAQQQGGSGGDWYASQNAYLSQRFAQAVVQQHYRQRLTVEQASDLLGIKPKNFAGIEQRILQGAGA